MFWQDVIKKLKRKQEIKTEFSFLNISAVGVYEGELNDSLADGEGSFASTDENKIKVSGNWEKGKLIRKRNNLSIWKQG